MRKIVIGILFLFFVSYSFAQTTMEEWNYITKGYKIQKESGLDMKSGYEFTFDHKQNEGNIFCEFSYLERVDNNYREKVAIMVYTNYYGGHYYCIPKIGNSDVDKLYQYEIYNWTRIKNPVSMLIMWQITSQLNWN